MRKKLRTMVAMAAVATLAASGAATAAQPMSKAKPSTVAYQGVQVAIDPATGRLRAPTTAERQALSNAILRDQAARPAAGQRPRTESEALSTLKINRKGRLGMSMQVPDSQFNYLTAERNADGTISIRHEGDGESPAPQQEVTQ